MSFLEYFLIFICGLIAGTVNIIAAGGSFLTLPLLIFLGLPPTVANATNRIGIIMQNFSGIISFNHSKYFSKKKGFFLVVPSILGGIAGAFLAVDINEELMKKVISICMLIVLVFMFIKPQKWILEEERKSNPILEFIVFFLIGIYGGFIQAGVGVFLLTALVLSSSLNLDKANAYKVLIAFSYNIIALAIFSFNDLVNWKLGFILGSGACIGGFIGSKLSMKGGSKFIRLILSIIISIMAIKLLFF